MQNLVHSIINCCRFSKRSPRRYAASTLSPTVCANAISATSAGKFVRSATQSRNDERKPCTVRSPRPMRRSTAIIAVFDSGFPRFAPWNTKPSPAFPFDFISSRITRTGLGRGTRCSLPAFMRWPGTTQTFSASLISSQVAPIASPVRAAVSIVNSRARAAMPPWPRRATIKSGNSAYGSAVWCFISAPWIVQARACLGAHASAPGCRPCDSRARLPNRAPPRYGRVTGSPFQVLSARLAPAL